MSTHVPGFQSFSMFFLHHFVLAKLATRSIRAIFISTSGKCIGALGQNYMCATFM